MKNLLLTILVCCFFYGCSSELAVINTEQPSKTQFQPPHNDISTLYPADTKDSSLTYPIVTPQAIQTSTTLQPLTPNDGFASIRSQLIYGMSQKPQSNTRVVLVPARKEDNIFMLPVIITSGFPELGDFIGLTDGQGNFQIKDIQPGNYFLIVNFPDETVMGNKEGKEFLISLEKNQILDLGILSLE